MLHDNTIRLTVGVFVLTLLFAAGTRARIETDIPRVTVTLAVLRGVASVMAFPYLIDYTARLLRPVSIVCRIGEHGPEVIGSVYPEGIKGSNLTSPLRIRPDDAERIVQHQGRSAIVLALNLRALVAAARNVDGVIEFVRRIGDFVATGEPLFWLYGRWGEGN